MRPRWAVMVLKVALFLTIAIAGFGQAVLHLWNWLMPGLFGLHSINFWQAVGLMALSWILFGGWRGFHRRPGSGHRGRLQLRHRLKVRLGRKTTAGRQEI